MPRISVLFPVYNAERYLAQAIDSVLRQTFEDFEVLLFDDGSTDRSLSIARERAASDSRVILVNGDHKGLVYNLNAGLDMANGELIARMDADDVSLPNRFASQLRFLDTYSECCAVGTQATRIDPDGSPINLWQVPENHEQIDEYHMQVISGAIIHPSVMMRKRALCNIGGYRKDFEWAEDYDLFLRLAEVGRLANLPDVLLLYRMHFGAVTSTRLDAQRQATLRAYQDAWKRRGKTGQMPPLPHDLEPQSQEAVMWSWARSAFANRNFGAARKWAFRLLRRRPADLRRWALFGGACLGPLAVHVKRISSISVGAR